MAPRPMDREHQAVMGAEVVEWLRPRSGGVYVDATVGSGGHAALILEAAGENARLIGIDRDPEAIERSSRRLEAYGAQVQLFCADFSELGAVLRTASVEAADGIVLDLGVSTPQLLDRRRGFTYQDPDAPLDMRMDPRAGTTAATLLNTLGERELASIFRRFGEERWAPRIARFVVEWREREAFERSGQLVDCVKAAIPAALRRRGGHPARRVFQALRIAVNDELDHLERGLAESMTHLKPGGRVVAISFHSLEDRIVKQAFSRAEREAAPVPMRVLTRKPLRPSPGERARNPRSRSAGLRVAERLELAA